MIFLCTGAFRVPWCVIFFVTRTTLDFSRGDHFYRCASCFDEFFKILSWQINLISRGRKFHILWNGTHENHPKKEPFPSKKCHFIHIPYWKNPRSFHLCLSVWTMPIKVWSRTIKKVWTLPCHIVTSMILRILIDLLQNQVSLWFLILSWIDNFYQKIVWHFICKKYFHW